MSSSFQLWNRPEEEKQGEEEALVNMMRKEKQDDLREMKNSVLVSSKIRKLKLRIALWDIYEEVFLTPSSDNNDNCNQNDNIFSSSSSSSSVGKKVNKNRLAAQKLEERLEGQRSAQHRVATIFSSDSEVENWASVISKLQFFEKESDTIPLVKTEDVEVSPEQKTVMVQSMKDEYLKEVQVDFNTDPHQVACEMQMEFNLSTDDIEYIQGMLQHEMVELVRQGMTEQRAKLKSIQKNTAIIEHLVMLNESTAAKFHKASKMYDTSSSHLKATAASSTSTPNKNSFTSPTKNAASQNRTLVHFNKLIIDERRKLDIIEQEIAKIFKKMGKMTAADYYKPKGDIPIFTNGKEIPTPTKGGKTSAPPPVKNNPSNRRASVSLRSALMSAPAMSLAEEDEEEGGDGFSPPKPPVQPEDDDDEEQELELDLFGLSEHQAQKKVLFHQSEKDRKALIAENRRLRDIINSADMVCEQDLEPGQLGDSPEVENKDLRALIHELNSWDMERDELDGQIDNLNDRKSELRRRLEQQRDRKKAKVLEKESRRLGVADLSLTEH